jgi:peptidoglycan L-alanyl-D-glutamate endopeptidase CwlK
MNRSLDALTPEMKEAALELINRADSAGIDIFVTSTLRTLDEQQALYDQGRTKPGAIVTNAKPGESSHNFGLGFDVAFSGTQPYIGPWKELGALGESIGLEWGGRWRNPDQPHFQAKDWRSKIGRPLLSLGSTGPDVKRLQTALNRLLWWLPALKVDGILGPATDSYVWQFTKQIESMPDHSATTPAVWAALDAALQRIAP